MKLRPLAVSTGDPGGVGPEIAVRAAASQCENDAVVLFGDVERLHQLATRFGVDSGRVRRVEPNGVAEVPAGSLGLCQAGASWGREATRHEPTAEGGNAQLAALDLALAAALRGDARGLVTGPMSKAAVNLAGHDFTGHTEHLARAAGLADDAVTMMFLGPRLRVALVTTHLSIAELPEAVTLPRVMRAIRHLTEAVLRLGLREPARIAVTGLNPHAGEGGLFGSEETRTIAPAIAQARALALVAQGRVQLIGPVGAETAFRQAASNQLEAVVAMTHDQATIASKLLDWTQAVNVTWGLPFVRTSVDHGVAYDAAASGAADARGMVSALALAQRLTAAVS